MSNSNCTQIWADQAQSKNFAKNERKKNFNTTEKINLYLHNPKTQKRTTHTPNHTHTHHKPHRNGKQRTETRCLIPKFSADHSNFYSNISLKYFRHMSQTIPLLRPYWANTHPFNKTQPRIKLPPLRPHLIGEPLLRVTPPLRAPPPVAS